MAAFGYNPIEGYSQMFKTAFLNPQTHQINPRNIGEIFVTAAPLIFTALGFSVANSAGFFNIGLSGQALCGWVASIWLALSLPDVPKGLLVPVVLLVGALAGALAAAVPGVLRALFGTSEVIVTIMMNYIILYGANHIVTHVMSKDLISNTGKTKLVGQNATLQTEFLRNLTQGSRLNIGIFLALIFLVLTWFLMKKTTLGFEIRSVGLNPDASEYAGMSSKRTIIFSMAVNLNGHAASVIHEHIVDLSRSHTVAAGAVDPDCDIAAPGIQFLPEQLGRDIIVKPAFLGDGSVQRENPLFRFRLRWSLIRPVPKFLHLHFPPSQRRFPRPAAWSCFR